MTGKSRPVRTRRGGDRAQRRELGLEDCGAPRRGWVTAVGGGADSNASPTPSVPMGAIGGDGAGLNGCY